MEKLSNQERLKPWMGVILFVVGLLFLMFAGSFMQTKWGMVGLVTTELGFLAISVIYCLITRVKIKEVFPIKKITVADFFGVVFMLIGSFMLNLICVGVSLLFTPDASEEIGGLSGFLYGSTSLYIIIMLVAAILPAICEEAFMRGAVLSNFRSIKKDWVICLIIGAMFGILHLSPLRFLNTACLGFVLAFIMVKRNNILLPMLLHFLNNFISTVVGFVSLKASGGEAAQEALSAATTALDSMNGLTFLGSYLTIGFSCPIFFVLGAMLLDRKNHRPRRFLIAGIISAVLMVAGIALTSTSVVKNMLGGDGFSWNYSYVVTQEDISGKNLAESNFTVEEEKSFMVIVSATAGDAEIKFVMEDENGEVIFEKSSSGMLIVSESINLQPGDYTLYFEGNDDIVGNKLTYQVIVN
ncbi:MAG: CPBP family intramembrane metalloprotease [Lachnospiraceae bacterium]|nr:CPBP family intramembrane metalloprotease [Lachnospiraceae bacterium]